MTLNVLDQLKRLPGTTNVQIFGAKDYAMRIWLQPDRLTQLKLTPGDVIRAINEQNAQFAAGKVGQSPSPKGQDLVYTITTHGRFSEPREFEQDHRAREPGRLDRAPVRRRARRAGLEGLRVHRPLQRPARRRWSASSCSRAPTRSRSPRRCAATIAELAKRFPEGLTYAIPYDTTRFVEVSIREVVFTLGEAMLLVFLVVYLFLQSWRATIIPFVAVPVSLIGTFAGLYLLGYSINTLTLFGMVLSIGIVVDDAIVVLENVERIMREDNAKPREAAIKAMHEVTGPIVAIVLTLTAVFVPIAFLGGLTGELYRQFAVTISISVVISGLVALTLSPALCVADPAHARGAEARLLRLVQPLLRRVTHHYNDGRGVDDPARDRRRPAVRRHGRDRDGLWRVTPSSLVPDEDQGFYITAVILPDGATLERTDKVVEQVEKAIRRNPANEDVIAFTGFDFIGGGFRNNAATIFVTQMPWDERDVTAAQLVGELFGKTAGIKEALVLAFNPPPIFGLGTAGGYEFYIQNRGEGGAKRLNEVTQQFLARAQQDPQLASRRRSGAPTCRSSPSTSTARRRRSSACRSTTCSTRCRRRSATTTSTTSTSTAARGRC